MLKQTKELMDKYFSLHIEYEVLVELCEPIFSLKYKIERMQENPLQAEILTKDIAKDVVSFEGRLENKMDELEIEQGNIAIKLMELLYGYKIGDKVPFDHPGTGESGYIIAKEATILGLGYRDNDLTFTISGKRFRKDGKLGKRETSAYFKLPEFD